MTSSPEMDAVSSAGRASAGCLLFGALLVHPIVAVSYARAQCPDPPDPLVLITELANDGSNTFIELYNPGAGPADLTGWFLCHVFNYTLPGTLDGMSIDPGKTLVLQISGEPLDPVHADALIDWPVFGTDFSSGDMGLYDSVNFHLPEDLVDFLQWSEAGQGREPEADEACLWTAGDFIPAPLTGATLQLSADAGAGGLTGSDDYQVHSFALNNLKVYPPPPPTANGDSDGDEDVDLHDLAAFSACNPAPEVPADDVACTPYFDFDGDLDVDLADFAAFQIAYTGPRLPVDLAITGPDEVAENSSTGYSAMVTYTLGPAETLTGEATWSVKPTTYADVDANGVLTTVEVDADQVVILQASYAAEGTLVEDELTISIIDETVPAEPVAGTVAITELAGDGERFFVELYNTGDLEIDLTDWWLCLNPLFKYEEIAAEGFEVLGPNAVLVIQLGGSLDDALADHAITISPATQEAGDIGLYVGQDLSIFSNPEFIRDYLQWGAAGQNREDVADDAGLWTAGTYVEATLFDGAMQLLETGLDDDLTGVEALFVTPFSQHSLGVFPNPDPPADDDADDDDGQGGDDDEESPGDEDPPADDSDPDDASSDDEPPGTSDDDGESDSAPDDGDGTEDSSTDGGDGDSPAEDAAPDAPTSTDSSSSRRTGLCGLFGIVNLLALVAGLTLIRRLGATPAS